MRPGQPPDRGLRVGMVDPIAGHLADERAEDPAYFGMAQNGAGVAARPRAERQMLLGVRRDQDGDRQILNRVASPWPTNGTVGNLRPA